MTKAREVRDCDKMALAVCHYIASRCALSTREAVNIALCMLSQIWSLYGDMVTPAEPRFFGQIEILLTAPSTLE